MYWPASQGGLGKCNPNVGNKSVLVLLLLFFFFYNDYGDTEKGKQPKDARSDAAVNHSFYAAGPLKAREYCLLCSGSALTNFLQTPHTMREA